ncbi:hypothetical protein [Streptomyces sp. NPDC059788]|uniref:hypothetical protein n=1 Tax=Streptomyces sp. NPDC059788 TaxID=3346948 RepID=UPI003665616C
MTTTTIRVIECTSPDELYRQYSGQSEPQPCYIELDLREGVLLASYNAEIGNAVPFSVHYGFDRRYDIPLLHAEAANQALRDVTPLADRILADWEQVWDGNNLVARLGKDAQAAEEELDALLEDRFAESDQVTVWDVDSATNGCEADEYSITAETTDDRLDEIEEQIRQDLAGVSGSGSSVVVLEGVNDYLRRLRDGLGEDDA